MSDKVQCFTGVTKGKPIFVLPGYAFKINLSMSDHMVLPKH